MEQASRARIAAMHSLAEAEAEADVWAQTQTELSNRTEAAINASLEQIREEARLANIQLARETEDRKNAELYRAAALIKQEMVARAVETLQVRYAAEGPETDLGEKVDQFVRLLELIA